MIVASLVLAGCVGPDGPAPERSGEPPKTGGGETPGQSHGNGSADQAVDRPAEGNTSDARQAPRLPGFAAPVTVDGEAAGAEPVVDVASDATIFLQGIGFWYQQGLLRLTNKVWRSTDDGASWTDVTPPATGEEASADGFVHVAPDDGVYVANAAGGKISVWRSTDLGDSWIPLPVPQAPNPVHRMWMASTNGSLHLVMAGLVYEEPVTGLYHTSSDDGGRTWTTPRNIDPQYTLGSQLVAHDGALYLASFRNESRWVLVSSPDGGDTWEETPMWDLRTTLESSWESLTVDANGTLYFTWAEMRNGTARVLYRSSPDGGDTWSRERPVAGPADGTQTMPWADAHAPGVLDLVWYAAEEPGKPGEVEGAWYGHVARIADADTSSPHVNVTRLTPDPVHEGSLCNEGPACRDGRDLADYPWITHGPDDAIHVGLASSQEKPAPPPVEAPVADSGVPLYVGQT